MTEHWFRHHSSDSFHRIASSWWSSSLYIKRYLFVASCSILERLVTRTDAFQMSRRHEIPWEQVFTDLTHQAWTWHRQVFDTHSFLNMWRYVGDSHWLNLRAIELTRWRCRRCHVSQHFFLLSNSLKSRCLIKILVKLWFLFKTI